MLILKQNKLQLGTVEGREVERPVVWHANKKKKKNIEVPKDLIDHLHYFSDPWTVKHFLMDQMWKINHPVSGHGIRTYNFVNASLLP